jgi:hypothetical protein
MCLLSCRGHGTWSVSPTAGHTGNAGGRFWNLTIANITSIILMCLLSCRGHGTWSVNPAAGHTSNAGGRFPGLDHRDKAHCVRRPGSKDQS